MKSIEAVFVSVGMIIAIFVVSTLTLSIVSCDQGPDISDKPTKEQAVRYVENMVGIAAANSDASTHDATLRWYIPHQPEIQAHGASNAPARSLVFYERSGFCFLVDLGDARQPHFLAPCDAPMPKNAVKP